MKFSKKQMLAVLAGAALLLPLTAAAPAAAAGLAPTQCHVLLGGPTPAVEVDTNNDGNPEVRVPSISNVRLCVTGDVTLNLPTLDSTDCGPFLTCKAFYIGYGVSGEATAQFSFCHAIDGSNVCGQSAPMRVPVDVIDGGTICVGYDLRGGSPCGGQFIDFQ